MMVRQNLSKMVIVLKASHQFARILGPIMCQEASVLLREREGCKLTSILTSIELCQHEDGDILDPAIPIPFCFGRLHNATFEANG